MMLARSAWRLCSVAAATALLAACAGNDPSPRADSASMPRVDTVRAPLPSLRADSRLGRRLVSIPFLDPAKVGSYGRVALYSLGIFVTFLVFSWLLVMSGNGLRRKVASGTP